MEEADQAADARLARLARRADFVLAVLAGLATVGFAWTGYQSASWIRERFEMSDLAARASVEAVAATTEADRTLDRDTLLYAQWLAAIQSGDPETAEALYNLFGEDLQELLADSGVAEDGTPVDDPLADPEYEATELKAEAARLEAEAREFERNSREASSNAARYGGIGVTFTSVLAATGIALRFSNVRLQRVFVVICSLLTLAALALTLVSPVNFG